MQVIDEDFLRKNRIFRNCQLIVADDDVITPSAKDYITVNKIKVIKQKNKKIESNLENFPIDNTRYGASKYTDAVTGVGYAEKPEDMTHLRGNLLVKKNHLRIKFRGKIDSLEAEIILAQIVAQKNGNTDIVQKLDEVLAYVRAILSAEVKESVFDKVCLFGYDDVTLRERSHNPNKYYNVSHPLPSFDKGELFAVLNKLRTSVREVEIAAVDAFSGERTDIVKALNRLSSAVYILELSIL